jgi:hypothetical protein
VTNSKKPKKPKSKFSTVRHPFLFSITRGDGTTVVKRVWAKVVMATEPVTLTVTEEHIRRAIAVGGIGNTSRCTMAICCYQQQEAFPHKIEGHVDWNYSRAFVVTKTDKLGLPSECVAYEHSSGIARLNDTPDGLEVLLKRIADNGPITVTLRPYRKRSEEDRPHGARVSTGVRDPSHRGANLRLDVAYLNNRPQAD